MMMSIERIQGAGVDHVMIVWLHGHISMLVPMLLVVYVVVMADCTDIDVDFHRVFHFATYHFFVVASGASSSKHCGRPSTVHACAHRS